MLIGLLLAYSLGVSYLLVRRQGVSGRRSELDAIWQRITSNPNPSPDDIKAIAEVAKVRQSEIPWYERSLSTLGIVAFFSMIIATSVQTINSVRAEVESSNLRQETKALESQRNTWKKLVKELSEVVILKQANNNKLEKAEEDILKQRLGQIEELEKPGKEEEGEKLKIYLALKQYDQASNLIGKSASLGDGVQPENLLFLAEMSFVDGAKGQATSLLDRFESQLSNQPVEWQKRFYVIRAALNSDPQSYCKQVAALNHSSLNEAEEYLKRGADELRRQASRRVTSPMRPLE